MTDEPRRKIEIRLKVRDPKDTRGTLEAVGRTAQGLSRRPRNRPPNPPDMVFDITVGDPDCTPDEQLETQAQEYAAKALDQRAEELDEQREMEEGIENLEVRAPSMTVRNAARAGSDRWFRDALEAGWTFAVTVVPEIVKQVIKQASRE
jgi:hypothetical protein